MPTPHSPLGRFQLVSELGRGAMGVVYRVHDPTLGIDVALKVLGGRLEPLRLERFRREGEIAATLDHPGIVRVHSAGTLPDGQPYLTYELVEGEELGARMFQLPLEQRVSLLRDAAHALAHAHAHGVIHRDLKPENLLLGPGGTIHVTDFGVARATGLERMTRSGATVGTPAYMAPEQFNAAHEVGPASDVWSLGVILYEALTEEHPFPGTTMQELMGQITDPRFTPPSSLVPSVPKSYERICLKALSKNARDRYPHAGELAADLDRALAGKAVLAARRLPLLPFGLATAAVAFGTVLALALGGNSTSTSEPAPAADRPSSATPGRIAQLLAAGEHEAARDAAERALSMGREPTHRRLRGHAQLLLGDLSAASADLEQGAPEDRAVLRLARHLASTETRLSGIDPNRVLPVSPELGGELELDLSRLCERANQLPVEAPDYLRRPLLRRTQRAVAELLLALTLNVPFKVRDYAASVRAARSWNKDSVEAVELEVAERWHRRQLQDEVRVPPALRAAARHHSLDSGMQRLLDSMLVEEDTRTYPRPDTLGLLTLARATLESKALPRMVAAPYMPWRGLWIDVCILARQLAWEAFKAGDRAEGIARCELAVEAGKNAVQLEAEAGASLGRLELALAYILRRDTRKARQLMPEARSLPPQDIGRAQLILAECDMVDGEVERALGRLDRLVGWAEENPRHVLHEEIWIARLHARLLLGVPNPREGIEGMRREHCLYVDWHRPEHERELESAWWPGEPLPPGKKTPPRSSR